MKRLLNDLFLQTTAKGLPLTLVQQGQILSIALQCPLEGGPAVFRARAWYAALTGERIVVGDCEGVGERGSNTAKSNDSPKLLIFPNPASNKINVSYPTNRVSAVILYNHIGHEVARVLPAEEQSTLAFDVSSFPPGLYICHALQGNKPVLSQKFIVIK